MFIRFPVGERAVDLEVALGDTLDLFVVVLDDHLHGAVHALGGHLVGHHLLLHDLDVLGISGHESVSLVIHAGDDLRQLVVEDLDLTLGLDEFLGAVDVVDVGELVLPK